ncbi:hypothetical protein ACQEVC_26345 [Plantactinospora sp. CA-294935]|uniref:hypothetical protein n=1 Tax=Plantactinospora sp. CA-294935 TaxID=3240012 RepID=UPI003D8C17EB
MLAALLTGGLVATDPASPAAAAPTDAAFNPSTGTLNVNYANYLSKHDIVYNRPNTNPLHGLTVGNGKAGAVPNLTTWRTASTFATFSTGWVPTGTAPRSEPGAAPVQFRRRETPIMKRWQRLEPSHRRDWRHPGG